MKLVTVFTTFNPAEAQVIYSRLLTAGFHASLLNELTTLSLGVGGTLVQVPDNEADDARELLAAADNPPADESQPE